MRRGVGLATLLLTVRVWAGGPLVLVPATVPQYTEAARAVMRKLAGAESISPADPRAVAKTREASVVVAVGQKAFTLARSTGTSPVVFCMVLGVSRSALSPRITGIPLETDPSQVFEQIKTVLPSARRVGVVYERGGNEILMAAATEAAASRGLKLTLRGVHQATEVREAVAALAGSVDVLWLPPNPQLISKELFTFLLGFSAERRLPLFGFLDSFTEAGAVASVSPGYVAMGERAGMLAAEISARPDNRRIPVPGVVFVPGNLTINLRTAKAFGLDVPPEAIRRAKQVFR